MSKVALLAAIAGAALLAAPLGAEAQTFRRPAPPRFGPGPMRAMPAHFGRGPFRPVAAGYGFGYRPRPYGARYGYRPLIRAAATAVGYGIGYGYGAGYGRTYGYSARYGQGYGYGYRTTAYAAGPYAPQPMGQCNCAPTAYQPASTIAYVPVTTYKAVRVYYAPQQQPYYNVPPYAQQ